MKGVSIPRGGSDLKACSVCWKLSVERRACLLRRDSEKAKAIEEKLQRHLKVQYAERDLYHMDRTYARENRIR